MADLARERARALVDRAVDKAEQLGLRGAVAVVGASGALVTASRLDRGGAGGMARAVAKAWISATQQIPSAEHLRRMATLPAPIAAGFVAASPQARFPGAGGLPIRDDGGAVVAGIAASGATVGPFLPDDVPPAALSAGGEPANAEDLLIAYALGIAYAGQHGDDRERWRATFGELTVAAQDSLGLKPAPPASAQPELARARALTDRVLALAKRPVAVAVLDAGGEPVQLDRMDGAPAAAIDVAEAVARAAARFGMPSEQVAAWYGDVRALHPHPVLTVPGGLPIPGGGLGVGGEHPAACLALARAALE